MNRHYLLTDYIHWRGGMWNVQRARIMVGGMGGYIKIFTSEKDMAEKRAIAWAKKNNIKLD